jgi:hypothetical protein
MRILPDGSCPKRVSQQNAKEANPDMSSKAGRKKEMIKTTSAANPGLRCVFILIFNAAPHLSPPRRQVERKYDIRNLPNSRAESAGGIGYRRLVAALPGWIVPGISGGAVATHGIGA